MLTAFWRHLSFFYPLSQDCDCSVSAQQIFAAFCEFMSVSNYFQMCGLSREDGAPKCASKMAHFQQVVYVWLLQPLGMRPEVWQRWNTIATERYNSVLWQDCTSIALIFTIPSGHEISLDYKEGTQQWKTDPCFSFTFFITQIFILEKDRAKWGRRSRAAELLACEMHTYVQIHRIGA